VFEHIFQCTVWDGREQDIYICIHIFIYIYIYTCIYIYHIDIYIIYIYTSHRQGSASERAAGCGAGRAYKRFTGRQWRDPTSQETGRVLTRCQRPSSSVRYIHMYLYIYVYIHAHAHTHTHTCTHMHILIHLTYLTSRKIGYWVATISRLLKIIGLFCRI